MKTPIPKSRVDAQWSKLHPKTIMPSVKAYYVSRQDLNKIANESYQGKGDYYQTKHEYGKHISPKTHSFEGAHYKHNSTHIILVRRQDSLVKTNYVIRHELNHIRKR